eukprot:CAMPEP_0183353420 /NCGR_PEP_ID=MMETSP0164_2-20130417/33247_1 /TAXON_ID=221442 /ORGANISM="Coccolithus pelagicus ssp braarudi, Strain PLY182g" /LENGTH=80 /DNA_ID=CAMNT_0025526089 /DNA_START=12 /DNA_END=255 /DNA_ORIENTATION=-
MRQCVAYEYAHASWRSGMCELHKRHVSHVLLLGGYVCRIKPSELGTFRGELPREVGSHMPAPPMPMPPGSSSEEELTASS